MLGDNQLKEVTHAPHLMKMKACPSVFNNDDFDNAALSEEDSVPIDLHHMDEDETSQIDDDKNIVIKKLKMQKRRMIIR